MTTKTKICFFYQTIYPGLEKSIFIIDKFIDKKKYEYSYLLSSEKMFYRKKKNIRDINTTSGFKGFNNSIRKDNLLKKKRIDILDNKKFIKDYIKNYQIVVTGSCREINWLVKFCKLNNIFLVVHKNPANFDSDGDFAADLYLVHSNYLINKKNKAYTYNTGSMHYAYIENKKKELNILKKYNLKKNKYLIFFDEGPQFNDNFFINERLKLLKNLKQTKYRIIIKFHPTFLQKRKISLNSSYKKYIKEVQQNFKICKGDDYPELLKNCFCGISNFGTMFFELNYFGKPIVYINRFKIFEKLYKKKINHTPSNYNFQYCSYNSFIKKNKFEISYKKYSSSNFKYNFKFYGADIKDTEILDFFKKKLFIKKINKNFFSGKRFMQIIIKNYQNRNKNNIFTKFLFLFKFYIYFLTSSFKSKFTF